MDEKRTPQELQPIAKLALLLEEMRPRIEECGFVVMGGMLGMGGQTIYPVAFGVGVGPMVCVYFRRKP